MANAAESDDSVYFAEGENWFVVGYSEVGAGTTDPEPLNPSALSEPLGTRFTDVRQGRLPAVRSPAVHPARCRRRCRDTIPGPAASVQPIQLSGGTTGRCPGTEGPFASIHPPRRPEVPDVEDPCPAVRGCPVCSEPGSAETPP